MCVCGFVCVFVPFFVFVCGSNDRYVVETLSLPKSKLQKLQKHWSLGQGLSTVFLAAKHPLLFAEVHWTSLAAGRTTSSPWLDYLPLAAGVNIGLPLPAGVKRHLHTWHCRGQPLWHWSLPPMDIGFQCWGNNPWFCCALCFGKVSSCCCALSKAQRNFSSQQKWVCAAIINHYYQSKDLNIIKRLSHLGSPWPCLTNSRVCKL